jgi:ABC-type branched-subunit amino acid transport system substrate-binding protein
MVSVDGAAAIVGALASGVTIPVAQAVSSVEGIPQISGSATAPGITTLADNDFLFRTTPHDTVRGIVLADLVMASGLDRVAVLFRNDYYGNSLSASFEARYKAIGGVITNLVPFEEAQANYRGVLSWAAGGDPQALVQIAFPGDGVPILKEAVDGAFFNKFVFIDGMKSTELVDAIGAKFLDGSIGTAPDAGDSARLFRAAYEAEHGEAPPLPFIDTFYDAAFILALAIEKAGTTDGAAVRDAIRLVANPPGQPILAGEWETARRLIAAGTDIDYAGAAGSQNFDTAGDVPGSFGIWTIADGEIKTLRIIGSE